MKRKLLVFILVFLTMVMLAAPQEPEPKQECPPVFIKATLYPTLSLSRYDYNNDMNRQELRVYIELREKGIQGEPVQDAMVKVNGTLIKFDMEKKDYRQRIHLTKEDHYPRDIIIDIQRPGNCTIHSQVTFPGWLMINNPQPAVLSAKEDLKINWTFSSNHFPLILHVFDFKKNEQLYLQRKEASETVVLTNNLIPEDAIIRIWVTSEWFFKKYLRGDNIVKGSEISIMPWSQVFVRTGKEK